ncbi:VOC family protein [Cytobacillus praedii]|uniref:VOC family protein n=1 Tax=Cytobacillus praedii TaxID=1742358 RepID=A0A4R1AVH2_9BACI|nr:VOC family protein [Cytobacillus praedii]MED3549677.1 VOC family protein [Cytobacillus praedii]TCJ02133.1 VOC family protein [Cytobacillus praedii]
MIKGLYEAHLPVSNLKQSIDFYKKLGLEIAYQTEKLVFFWIEKGKSWIGLWETEKSTTPYHPSLRHIALQIDIESMQDVKEWLELKGVKINTNFGFPPEQQPLVLPNYPNAHAAIYFLDPDGNSLELIAPLNLDCKEPFEMMTLEEWNKQNR